MNFLIRFSYEPEIHPGATVRLNNKAVLKVFTTGRITLTGKEKKKGAEILCNDVYLTSWSRAFPLISVQTQS